MRGRGPNAALPVEPATRPLRVLVVEDNTVNQRLAVSLLERRRHIVMLAANGREALAALHGHAFDVVLMDVQMPEMGGFEATTAIRDTERATGRHMPILAMTAHAMKGDRERCLAAGMDEYVTKPLDSKLFCILVESMAAADRTLPDAARMSRDKEHDRTTPDPAAANDVTSPARPRETGLPDPPEPSPPAPRDDARPHVSAQVLERVGGDRELLVEISLLFIDDVPRHLAGIREALDAGDGEALRRAAHGLKGAAANFDADAVVNLARTLEDMGRSGEFDDQEAVWRGLTSEIDRLVALLRAISAS